VERWSDASAVARHVSGGAHEFVSTDPHWLRLVPAAAALLLGDLSGPNPSGGGSGADEADADAAAAAPADPAAEAAWAEWARRGRVGAVPGGGGGLGGGRGRNARKDQAVPLALPGREAECVAKFLAAALLAAAQPAVAACGGAAAVCVCVLRGACGAAPSWTLDALTLVLRSLARALATTSNPPAAAAAARAQAHAAGARSPGSSSSSSGSSSGSRDAGAAAHAARLAEAQLLCGALAASMHDPRFPRASVTDDAKQQFLNFAGLSAAKGDWSGVKSAVKQLCGGKRKTGAGQSLGRPPDHAPWEANFDIRGISCY
jgi:hypothetical protein